MCNEKKSHENIGCCCSHSEENEQNSKLLLGAVFAGLVIMILTEHLFKIEIPNPYYLLIASALYLTVAWQVWRDTWKLMCQKDFFNEFSLMSMASIGAFIIGDYMEGIAVMLFYRIGEEVQEQALIKARSSIRSLLDVRPQNATVHRDGRNILVPALEVLPGEELLVAPGERVALDGELLDQSAEFDTACLTGESVPALKQCGETVLAGMISLDRAIRIRVKKAYSDTMLSKILHLVEDASERKSKVQGLISRIARIYTPVVTLIAFCVAFLPFFFVQQYHASLWVYRALFFLVLSCPCALLISIPLGYFGGIGLAARHGILLKGANYLDALCKINVVALDKTGTLTHGIFHVVSVMPSDGFSEDDVIGCSAALEGCSKHPVARAVATAAKESFETALDVREVAGSGMKGVVNGHDVCVGRLSWLEENGVRVAEQFRDDLFTMVFVAIDGKYAGAIAVEDKPKDDALKLIGGLKKWKIRPVLLSGDRAPVVERLANELGIKEAHSGLLPQDKLSLLQKLKSDGYYVAGMGDGVNDAPLLAASDIGIAMGNMGSDVAVEISDVVIQDDRPSKLLTALKIGRLTRWVVWENIILALVVKGTVLVLGLFGLGNLWIAVFADVGVALIALGNAVRLQRRF